MGAQVQQAGGEAVGSSGSSMFREIDASLLGRADIKSGHVHVELLRRRGRGPVKWRYRQERHAVFCFENGVQSCTGVVDGRAVRSPLSGTANLAFVAAGSSVEAVFDVPADCSYVVASFDERAFIGNDEEFSRLGAPESRVGFTDRSLTRTVWQLRRECLHADGLSRLLLETWAAQAWALLHRRQLASARDARKLGPATLDKVLARMRERPADDVSLAELAALAGLSPRQFDRRFRANMGCSPARALDGMRLDLAATLLKATRRSVTDIAMECGFSQPQHLATAFKRRFGATPTGFRTAMS